MVRRVPLVLAVGLLVAVPLSTVTSHPAGAVQSDCTSGNACVWEGTHYEGKMVRVSFQECTAGSFKSAANNLDGANLILYQGANCEGPIAAELGRGEAVPDVNAASAAPASSGGGGGDVNM